VLGNGYGGFVALQMAIRHPEIASKFILADCGAAFSEPGREAFRNMAKASREKGLEAITDVAMRRLFAPEFQAQHADLMQDRRAAFLRTDPDVFRAACHALASLDLRSELSAVKVPVLVLVGEHDEATPPPMSHELAAGLPRAELKIIPGCAHVPQLQSPRQFLGAMKGFLL
jgi:3-oxoadipate enol-lactonase